MFHLKIKQKIKSVLEKILPADYYYDIFESRKRKLTHLVMDISSTCNAKCPYCPRYNDDRPFKNNGIMTFDVFLTIYDQLKNLPDIKTISLYAFGEPLLNKNAGLIIRRLKELNKELVLSTNTTNLTNFIDDLMSLDEIQFSIEGDSKESYENYRQNLKFEETLTALNEFNKIVLERRTCGKATPHRSIHCLFTKDTNILNFVNTWSPYVDQIRFSALGGYLSFNDNMSQSIHFLPNDIKNKCFKFTFDPNPIRVCHYIRNALTINSNGKVVLCCSDFSQHLNLGDYRNIKKAFNSLLLLNLDRDTFLRKNKLCLGCRHFHRFDKKEISQFLPDIKALESLASGKCSITYNI